MQAKYIHTSQKLNILLFVTQLSYVGFVVIGHFKTFQTFNTGFDTVLRNIQAESRKFVSYKKQMCDDGKVCIVESLLYIINV